MTEILGEILQVGFFAAVIRIATPLILATIGEMFTERGGVLNLGIEGIMLLSAMTGFSAAYFSGSLWLGILAAMMTGALAGLLMGLLTLMIKKTKVGKAMRATAQDIEAATFMGIDVDRIVVVVFLIGSALGGAAGTLVGLLFTQVDYYVGFQAGLKGFTAAVLGGIGSIHGAMLGGILLGLVESLAVTFLPSAYKDVVAFVILITVLIVRPWGLVGEKVPEKV